MKDDGRNELHLAVELLLVALVVAIIGMLFAWHDNGILRERVGALEQQVIELQQQLRSEDSPANSNVGLFRAAHRYHGVLASEYDFERGQWVFERKGRKLPLFTDAFLRTVKEGEE